MSEQAQQQPFTHHPAFPGGSGADGKRLNGKAAKQARKTREKKPARQVVGRKDAAKQEQIIDLLLVKEKRVHLAQLKEKVALASADFSDAIKAAAESIGVQASVLRSYIAAWGSEKFEDRKRNANQLSILFTDVPE